MHVLGPWFGLLNLLEDMWAMHHGDIQFVVEKGRFNYHYYKKHLQSFLEYFHPMRGGLEFFFNKIRVYNNMFAFCSFGGTIDDSVNKGKGPYVFHVTRQTYHNFGSLVPPDGCTHKFA